MDNGRKSSRLEEKVKKAFKKLSFEQKAGFVFGVGGSSALLTSYGAYANNRGLMLFGMYGMFCCSIFMSLDNYFRNR